jgi:hypothetical protein
MTIADLRVERFTGCYPSVWSRASSAGTPRFEEIRALRRQLADRVTPPRTAVLCSFNSPTKEEIYRGLKRKFQMAELITGRELCDLFRIEYESIVSVRSRRQC